MAAGKPVKIAILADAREAVSGFDKAGDAAQEAGRKFDGVADASDTLASASSQVAGGFGDLGGALSALPGPLGALGTGMEAAAPAIMGVTGAADLLNVATEKFPRLAGVASKATRVLAAAKRALGVAIRFALGPVGLIIAGIALAVGALVLLYKKNKTFRDFVNRAWAVIKTAFMNVFNYLRDKVPPIWERLKTAANRVWVWFRDTAWPIIRDVAIRIYNKFIEVKDKVSSAINTIKTKFTEMRDRFIWLRDRIQEVKEGIISKFRSMMDYVRDLPTKIKNAFSGAATWLKGIGKDIIQGLWNGLKEKWEEVKDWFAGVTASIPDLKGPPRKDRVLLTDNGRLIIDGLIRGLEDRYPAVRRSLRSLTSDVGSFGAQMNSSLTLDARGALSAGSAGSRGGNVYEITVQAPVGTSSADIGRALVKHIDAYERSGGRVRAS